MNDRAQNLQQPEILQQKRAGNQQRDAYIDHMINMVSQGYLPQGEFEIRRDKALTAATINDLTSLITDLPAMPALAKREVKVTYQVYTSHGYRRIKFSAKRWVSAIMTSLLLIIMPGPLMASAFGGFNHAPGRGFLPIILIFIGCVSLVISGVAFAPAESEVVPEG